MMLHRSSTTPIKRAALLIGVLLVVCFNAEAKKNRDVVVMKNGDRLTGEVKKLESGILYVETDYFSGSIGLDWLQVASVQSTGTFQISLKDGKREAGTIDKVVPGSSADDFVVHTHGGDRWTSAAEVVEIRSQKDDFWKQLSGSTNLGYSYTSGNRQETLTADAKANYTSTRWFGGVTFTGSLSTQSEGNGTNVVEFQTLDGLYLSHNSFLVGLGDFLHSSQQDIALRTTLGGGYGRYLLHTNHQIWSWLAGMAFTHEVYESNQGPPTNNAEGLAGMEYQLFRFDRYGLQGQLLVYPGLTDAPRVRTSAKIGFSVKLTDKFRTEFQYWNNFDSHPPFNTKRTESGISNSLGWTF